MTCPPCTHDCEQGKTCPAKGKQAFSKLESKEPLGYIASMALNDMRDGIYGEVRVYHEELGGSVPIYTHLPQRTWVGLTDDEIWEAYMESPVELDCSTDELYALSRTVEAKLKEKNL